MVNDLNNVYLHNAYDALKQPFNSDRISYMKVMEQYQITLWLFLFPLLQSCSMMI